MVKIMTEKWGRLEGLSILVSKHLIFLFFVLLFVITGVKVSPSFLINLLTHYFN